MKGLAPNTQKIFEAVSTLDCIRPYLLVGGTALSLQINTRQSEDLDFMKWRTSREERPEVDWSGIEKELNTIGEIQHQDILDIDHVEFLIEGVKLSFYSSPKYSPVKSSLHLLNNINSVLNNSQKVKEVVSIKEKNFYLNGNSKKHLPS